MRRDGGRKADVPVGVQAQPLPAVSGYYEWHDKASGETLKSCERLGQSFFVENRPGGGNNIGTEMAAHSPADGYTLFMANTVNAINNSLYQNLSYNFIADFASIAKVGRANST
jgi:tripartite-type tricarboxylate transporter receptor subunit TctC